MKIAITGHTRGLGAEFKKAYEESGYQVDGFSRSNGYDLRNWDHMQKMLGQISDHDMFINIAKPDFVQTTILYELWKRWKNQHRTIINISSGITYTPVCPKNLFDDPSMDAYRTAKVSLNEASAQLSFKSFWPKIVLVNPIHLYNDTITVEEQAKLTNWVNTFLLIMTETNNSGFNLKEITF
jgi:short-subunit dehydrogenase involved in D-alanine esterification of teichoic acids